MIQEINGKEKYTSFMDKTFPSEKTVEKTFEVNTFAHYLFYIKQKKCLGYLAYSLIYDRIEIDQIEVKESERKKGIASELMKKLIEIAERENAINITLEVKENNNAALALYHKFGFQKKAIREKYYNGIDGILMEKEMIR